MYNNIKKLSSRMYTFLKKIQSQTTIGEKLPHENQCTQ